MNALLDELLSQEAELQFPHFNETTAWELGSRLMATAEAETLPITIDITRNGHQLFHASRPGTSPDNDEWVKRKSRLVNRFGHSSYYIGQLLKSENKTIESKFLLPESEYAPHGGCFPLIVKDSGVIGTITVSGLPQVDDHALVVRTLRAYLAEQASSS